MTGPGYDLYEEAVYSPTTSVTRSSSSSSSPTVLDTTNLRVSFTAPSDGKVGLFYSCSMLNSPAGGVLCVAEGSSVVAQARVARTVAATSSTPGAYEISGVDPVSGPWTEWVVDLDPTTDMPGAVYVTASTTLSGLSAGLHTFDLAVMGYGGTNVTAGYGGPDGGAYGAAVIRVSRQHV